MTTVEDRVLGRIRYASDAEMPDMLHLRLLRSPYPHALVESIDLSDLDPGIVTFTRDDIDDVEPRYGPWIEDQPLIALDRVRHVGDPVVAVAAPTERGAAEALDRIDVRYRPSPAVFDAAAAILDGAPRVHDAIATSDNFANFYSLRPDIEHNVAHRFRLRSGRGHDGFEQAEVTVEGTFTTPSAAHAPLEPHASLAWWADDRLHLVTGTQTPFNVRQALAKQFHLPEDRVTVIVAAMGGSFGGKMFTRLEPIVAAVARKAGRPVRAILTRSEEFVTLNRHPATFTIRLGARRDGRLVAKSIRALWDTGAYADSGPGVTEKGGYAAIGPYRIPHVTVESLCVYTNNPPNGAYRGYAATQAVWASERLMDRLADALGLDPLDLRLMNLLEDGDRFATGEVMHNVRFRECLESAAAAVDWRAGRRGKGLAVLLKGMTTPSRADASVEIDERGRVILRSATTDMGQRPNETQTLLAASAVGIDATLVEVAPNSTASTPFDMRTTSSRSTHMMSHAIASAATQLRAQIAQRLQVEPDLLTFDGDTVTAPGVRRYRLAELEGARGEGSFRTEGGLDPDDGQGIASSDWHQGAAAVQLTVDDETGVVGFDRVFTSTYAGRVVDPVGAALQTEGSMTMGLGTTLFEAIDFDGGLARNANLADYCIPSLLDVPALDYELLEDPASPPHGLGETALPPIPAAVGNALATLGADVADLPITPEAVLTALGRVTDRSPAGTEAR